jgi:hypothetical protein
MNKEQSNKLNSYYAVRGVLEDNRGIIEPLALMGQAVEEFYRKVSEIDAVASRTKKGTGGATAAKKLAKEKLARLASSLAAAASIYAWNSSNTKLETALDYSYTEIKYATDNAALQRAMAIEKVLNLHRNNLEEYMISAKNLEELHLHIESYEDALEARGAVKSERVAGFRKLADLFREADHMLTRKIDRFMLRLKAEFPSFYDAYRSARTIVDL